MVFRSSETPRDTPSANLLSWIFDECRYNPDRPILVDAQSTDRSLSWSQIKSFVRQSGAGFRNLGVRKGECIFFHLRNNIYYMPLVYGCIAADCVAAASRPMWTAKEVHTYSRVIDAKWFVVDSEFIASAVEVAEGLGLSKDSVIVLDMTSKNAEIKTDHGTFKTTNYLLQHGEADWTPIDDVETAKSSIAMRSFTSGTSGIPKAVEFSHYSLVAQINQWDYFFEVPQTETRMLHYVNLGGISGHGIVTTALKLGHTIYVFQMAAIPKFVATIEALRPDLIMLDPYTATRLTNELTEGSQALQSFRDVRCIGMVFPADARRKLTSFLHPDCLVSRPYGITEIGTVTAVLPSQRDQHDPESVGFTWPVNTIRLIDEEGQEITESDKSGEICIKSPTMFSGYYKNPSATEQAFDKDGWFTTGDIGYMSSATKQWHLSGRKKEIFKVNYMQVSPEEIESVLTSHPDIADAAVAPVFEESNVNPKIKAYIVPRSGHTVTCEQVLEFMEGKLASHKAINGGVEFVEKIPRNPAGKMMRHALT